MIGKAIDDGKLREDLYHRLAVIPLYLPPLRERRGDVRLLAESFLRRFAEENGKKHAQDVLARGAGVHQRVPVAGQRPRAQERDGARGDLCARRQHLVPGPAGPRIILSEDREVRIPVGTSLQQAERTLVLKTFRSRMATITRPRPCWGSRKTSSAAA